MRNWSRNWSVRIALAAIALFVLQSTLVAAAEARAAAWTDAFGNPLCITGYRGDAGQPAGGHLELPNCCAFGCGASASGLEASGGPAISAPGLLLALVRPGLRQAFVVPAADHAPGRPRAPPLPA